MSYLFATIMTVWAMTVPFRWARVVLPEVLAQRVTWRGYMGIAWMLVAAGFVAFGNMILVGETGALAFFLAPLALASALLPTALAFWLEYKKVAKPV